jgi:hypothetical protein
MTASCRRCKADIFQRYTGTMAVWTHGNRRDLDHPAVPLVKVAPPSESEKRAAWGDR